MRGLTVISSVLLLAAYPSSISAACYFPDGTVDKNVEYQPCSKNASNPLSTICCATNRKDGADICAPNGLCQVGVKAGSPPSNPAWTKPSCTNADWKKDGCLHVCGDDKYPFLTPCNRAAGNSSQRWCCGTSQDCCNEESNLSIEFLPLEFDPRNFTRPSSTSSSASTPAAKTPSSTSPSATPSGLSTTPSSSPTPSSGSSTETSPPSPQTTSSGLSTGAKAGIGIGIAALVLIIAAVAILVVRKRSRQSSSAADERPFEKEAAVYAHYGSNSSSHGGDGPGGLGAVASTRKDPTMEIHEMPVFENRGEWEANERLRSGNIELAAGRDTKEMYA